MGLCIWTVIFVVCFASPPGLAHQQGSPVTGSRAAASEENANRVRLSAVVLDKQGEPVPALRPEDFRVYEDDRLLPESGLAVAEHSNSGRVVAFVVDNRHMDADSVYRANRLLDEFVSSKLRPSDRILIVPTAGGSGFYNRFTSDLKLLHRAVARLEVVPLPRTNSGPANLDVLSDQRRTDDAMMHGDNSMSGSYQTSGASPAPPIIGRDSENPPNPADIRERDAASIVSVLGSVIDALAGYPGRKMAVIFSRGLSENSPNNRGVRELAARAAESNEVFYGYDANAGVQRSPKSASPAYGYTETLIHLTTETGGGMLNPTAGFSDQISGLLVRNSSYYDLAFEPTSWDGKYHSLRIDVLGRNDSTVLAAAGFVAERTPHEQSTDPGGSGSFHSSVIEHDIDLQLVPQYEPDENGDASVVAVLRIDPATIHFDRPAGDYRARIEIDGEIRDAAGRIVDRFAEPWDLKLGADAYSQMSARGLLWLRRARLTTGTYEIREIVRDAATGKTGAVSALFSIPDPRRDALATSSVFTRPAASSGGTRKAAMEVVRGASFRKGEQVAYSLVIYNSRSKGNGELEMQVRIISAGKLLYESQPGTIKPLAGSKRPHRIVTGGVLNLGELPAGDYVLEIAVTDSTGARSTTERALFAID